MTTPARVRFRQLHEEGTFLLPNPFDVGSAKLLQHLGFDALATTSSGFAATLGRPDQQLTRDELVGHVATLSAAVDLPLNVDAEHGYAEDPDGVAETVERLAAAGAAGVSIEDHVPGRGVIPVAEAAERVTAAAAVCRRHGILLTGRAENHLYGAGDLGDTIARLQAYRDAGAGCVYAPGLTRLADIERVVREVEVPVNVLALRGGPSVPELAGAGVRRVSTGGALAWAAYGAMVAAAAELQAAGTSTYIDTALPPDLRAAAFTP